MQLIKLKCNSPEWEHFRRIHIGASDASIIMGMSPWKKPLELYQEKVLNIKGNENSHMIRGRELESVALQHFEQETGLMMVPMVAVHDEYYWMSASFDGMTLEQDAVVEIKCPGKRDHELALKGEIPKKYIPQLQHQMYVSDLQTAFYYSFDGNEGVIVNVKRDDDFIKEMLKKEKEFWNCLKYLRPPKF